MQLKYDKLLDKIRERDSGSELYTNTDPTPLPFPSATNPNIPAGSTFSNQTISSMFDAMLYPELFPTLTNPSSTFTLTQDGLQEIGLIFPLLNFSSTFSRGSISPAYGTSGFRSGLPNTYVYTGTGLANFPSTLLSDSKTPGPYTVLLGNQNWTGRVAYDAGEQPLSNKGNPFSTPLPAGQTGIITRTITGVYPWFATSSVITTLTQQSLALMNSAFVQVTMIPESGSDKQKAEFPILWSPITGVQFFNSISGLWEWLGGSQANSLSKWTVSGVIKTIQGNIINYNRYTHNDVLTGSRQLRFYTT